MKKIVFIGSSLDEIRRFPSVVKREAGYQLDRVQHGFEPIDWKPMKSIGRSVKEIRMQHQGQFRVIYLAKRYEAIYVLHAFKKKTQKTSAHDTYPKHLKLRPSELELSRFNKAQVVGNSRSYWQNLQRR